VVAVGTTFTRAGLGAIYTKFVGLNFDMFRVCFVGILIAILLDIFDHNPDQNNQDRIDRFRHQMDRNFRDRNLYWIGNIRDLFLD